MKIAIVKSAFCKVMSLIVVVIFLNIMRDIYLPVNFGLFQPLIFHRSLLIDTLSHIPQSRFIENYYLLLPGEKWHWRQSFIIHLLQKIYSIGTQNYLAANALKMGKRLKDEVNDLLRKSRVSAFAWSGHLLQASTRGKLFLTSQIAKNLPEPVATLYSQILFGKGAGGSKKLKHLFEITGTQHIAVVSGFNLTFLARFVTASLQLVLSKKQVAISVFFVLLAYCAMVGMDPSVQRAMIMSSFSLFASFYVRRQYRPRYALAAAAAIMFAADSTIFSNVSFQLSFAASAAIIFILPLIDHSDNFIAAIEAGKVTANGKKAARISPLQQIISLFADSLKLSLVVQLTVAPILIYHFATLNLLGPVASGLTFWLSPLIFGSGWVLVAAGIAKTVLPGEISGIVGIIFSVGRLLAEVGLGSLELIARISLPEIHVPEVSIDLIITWYIALIIIATVLGRRATLVQVPLKL